MRGEWSKGQSEASYFLMINSNVLLKVSKIRIKLVIETIPLDRSSFSVDMFDKSSSCVSSPVFKSFNVQAGYNMLYLNRITSEILISINVEHLRLRV